MSVTKVVILNWNGEEHLKKFLPAVLANTPAGVGIVVADNGSQDGSLALLEGEFPQVEIIRLDDNYGYAEGYNRALAQIDADFYILMNSDVEPAPDWFPPLIAAMEAGTRLAAVAPKLLAYTDRDHFEYAGASGGFIDFLGYPFCRGRILRSIERDNGQYDTPREVFWASGACMMVRAEAFREMGGFDETFFAHMEEIDLCWRLHLHGWRVGVEPRSTVYHLGGGTLPNDNPRKLYLNYRNNLAMLYKNLPQGSREFILFIRMVLDGASAAVFLLQGRPKLFSVVFRAHMDFHARRPALAVLRKQIRATATTRARWIYPGSILLRYFLGCRDFKSISFYKEQ